MSDGTNRAKIMQKFEGFLESLKNYSMTTSTGDKTAEVQNLVSNMAYTCYRWLTYQFDLDNGAVDEKLAEQQHEFLNDINSIAKDLAGEELLDKPEDFVCDTVGFISQLFAYNYSAMPNKEGNTPTREEALEKYHVYEKYAMDSAPIQAMLTHLGGEQSTIDSYMEMRVQHHSTSATVLRTLLIDYAMDWDWVERAGDNWGPQYQDASVYLFFFHCNSGWTADAIKWVLLSAFTYNIRSSEKERKDTLLFLFDLVDKMISHGERVMRSDKKLVGQELLDKVRGIPKMDPWLLSVQCGYTMGEDEDGETLADVEGFRAAYLSEVDKLGDPKQTLKEHEESQSLRKPPVVNIKLSDEMRNDKFLKELSEESIEVIEHFGSEAPALLNKYSCAVEDALIEQVNRANDLSKKVAELEERLKDQPESPE